MSKKQNKKKSSLIFLGKKGDEHCLKAANFINDNFIASGIYFSDWGDPLPEDVVSWQGDYIISYLSRWILSEDLLKQARVAAINFHPAPPEYPGVGCFNFALYDNVERYGVTCHHMAQKVDTGKIVAVNRFPVFSSDTVSTLLNRTYDFQLVLFYSICSNIIMGCPLPHSREIWTREPFRRKDLDRLAVVTPSMCMEERQRRIRATCYRDWQPQFKPDDSIIESLEND